MARRSGSEEAASDAHLEAGIPGPLGDEQPLGVRRCGARGLMHEQDERSWEGALTTGPDSFATEAASRIDLKHGRGEAISGWRISLTNPGRPCSARCTPVPSHRTPAHPR